MNPVYFYVMLLVAEALFADLGMTSAVAVAERCGYWVGWWAIVYAIVMVFAILGKVADK